VRARRRLLGWKVRFDMSWLLLDPVTGLP